MKKVIYIGLGIVVLIGLIMGIGYLIKSNSSSSEEFLTKKAFVQDLEDKVLATGKIIPREEIEIKPNISGIIQTIYVSEGDKVTAGQLIASIRIVPNISEINNASQEIKNAQLQISNAQLNVSNQQKQFGMQSRLFKEGVISKQEYLTAQQQLFTVQQQYKNAVQQLNTAQKRLQIVRTGVTPELQSLATTQVRAKADGTVLTVNVKAGSQVIEANSFNPGTTVCTIANLNALIFQGTIDEAQAGRLQEGMPMNIIIGALENKSFPGTLTLISPKGKEDAGTVKFSLEGQVNNNTQEYIRAGFSANAEIVLKSKKNTLLLDESLIQYEKNEQGKDVPFVEVKNADGSFKKVNVKLGGSDGINVEILSGITKNDEIKVWNPSDKDKKELKEKKNK